MLVAYRWPGNVRQLRNLVEQLSVIEQTREISAQTLANYLPRENVALVPAGKIDGAQPGDSISERELIFKFLFDMKNDLNALKEQVRLLSGGAAPMPSGPAAYHENLLYPHAGEPGMSIHLPQRGNEDVEHTEVEESLSLEEKERELIKKALQKHRGRRRMAAQELGISERTLYRKIKEWNIA